MTKSRMTSRNCSGRTRRRIASVTTRARPTTASPATSRSIAASAAARRRPVDALLVGEEVAGLAHRRREHPLLGRLAVVEDRHLAALAHDQDAVAHGQHLGQVGADQDDRHALRGQLVDQLVDLDLGADVDAARRLIEDEHLRFRLQPLADARPSAGCRRRATTVGVSTDGARMLSRWRKRLGGRPLLGAAHQPSRATGSAAARAARCWRRSRAASPARAGAGPRCCRRSPAASPAAGW